MLDAEIKFKRLKSEIELGMNSRKSGSRISDIINEVDNQFIENNNNE